MKINNSVLVSIFLQSSLFLSQIFAKSTITSHYNHVYDGTSKTSNVIRSVTTF